MAEPQPYRVALVNLGCRVNRYEADAVLQQFRALGFTVVDYQEAAVGYVVNSCAVTGEAVRKSGQFLRRARRRNPQALVVAMGCVQALEGAHCDADLSIGSKGKGRLAAEVLKLLQARGQVQAPSLVDWLSAPERSGYFLQGRRQKPEGGPSAQRYADFEELGHVAQQTESRAFIKIQDGCNQFCTYCTIPLARGRIASRRPEEVLAEARELVAAGYQEITLTGIHICSYGQDRGEGIAALMDLCAALTSLEGLERLRFGSMEPLSITPEFLERFAQNPKLCHHLHLSLQSGSEAVLTRMGRNYRPADYRAIVQGLRERMPDFEISTDIICAFPGESPAQHQESLDFCREMRFSHMHIFPYAPRPMTAAARMPEQLSKEVKQARCQDFATLEQSLRQERLESQLGRELSLLVEEELETAEGRYWAGYSDSYLPLRYRRPEGSPRLAELLEKSGKRTLLLPVKAVSCTGDHVLVQPL